MNFWITHFSGSSGFSGLLVSLVFCFFGFYYLSLASFVFVFDELLVYWFIGFYGFLVSWFIGLQFFWFSGILGSLIFLYIGLLVYWFF